MQLNKRQVKALLEVLSSDDTRPILTQAAIQKHDDKFYLVATDSYKLAAILLDNSVEPLLNKRIAREEIVKWYKLATAKDYFTEDTLHDIATLTEEEHGKYPDWQRLIPAVDKEKSEQTSIGVNATYLLTMELLADKTGKYSSGMYWDCYDNTMLVNRDNDNIYVVMELRKR